jgi:predicted dehydrogenase
VNKLKVAVIGLGKQASEDHLPAVAASDMYELLAVCDVDAEKVKVISEQYNVPGFVSLDDLFTHTSLDVIIAALPHVYYIDVVRKAAQRHIHIIKEKPFAISIQEAIELQQLIHNHRIYVGVTLQRRFNPVFQAFHQLKRRIGKIYLFEGRYTFNIQDLGQGWRAWRNLAGGGALIDMGYHFVDLLVWYFGIPTTITARLSRGNREGQAYDAEDTAHLMADYVIDGQYHEKIIGDILISRVYPRKEEELLIYGTKGSIKVQRGKIERFDLNGTVIEALERTGAWQSAAIDQIDYHARQISQFSTQSQQQYHEQLRHIAMIEAAYRSDATGTSVNPSTILEEYGLRAVADSSSWKEVGI